MAQPPGLWAKPHFLNARSSSDVAGRSLPPCGCLSCLSLWRTQHLSGLLPMVTWVVINRLVVTIAQVFLELASRIRGRTPAARGVGGSDRSYYRVSTSERGSSTKDADKNLHPGMFRHLGRPAFADRLELGVEVNLRLCQDTSPPV